MKVRLIGIPHFGQEDKPYNNPKGKMYFILVTHPDRWGRPLSTAECLAGTGLELDGIRDYGRETNGLFAHRRFGDPAQFLNRVDHLIA